MKFNLAAADKPIIIVKAEVNGSGPFDFAVDTGACLTAISEQTARKLGISDKTSTSKECHSCCGDIKASEVIVESVRVGTAEAREIHVTVMDLSAISKAMGAELEGIVGYNFMKDYRVLIDYRRQEISFEKT
jgi:clan AA aspartic protease (TIGR02281 family)